MAYLPYSYYNGVYTTLDTVRAKLILCFQNLSSGGNSLIAGDVPGAGNYIYLAGVYGLQANSALTWSPATNNTRYFLNQCFNWIAGHLNDSPTATVDMDGIIAAMFDAEYTQISDFVGLMWAFQQILWDQPFFPDKYAEIVNRVRT